MENLAECQQCPVKELHSIENGFMGNFCPLTLGGCNTKKWSFSHIAPLWDDRGGHQLAGVLLEGRYRIDNVRKRTAIRSTVLVEVLEALRENQIPLALQGLRIDKFEAS